MNASGAMKKSDLIALIAIRTFKTAVSIFFASRTSVSLLLEIH